ncbi:MAG: tetratricopeptide repeat protein [Crocinitomicaceae bacterium]|nr:tetratricopeptide repeat protein [Flavobacteriales bacterium]NQZ35647.1 tetratricopeptide repeat protein [Crocinitomicaceae bacterium]
MNKFILYNFVFLFLLAACGGTKELTKKNSPVVPNNTYIETFHEGVRLKLTGRIEEAIGKFQKCLIIRQDDDAVYYALSELELMLDNKAASAEYIKKAAEIDPDNTWYIQELAYMYLNQKDYSNAIKNFDKLTKKEPRNIDWLYGTAQAAMESGNLTKCIEAMNKIEDKMGLNPQISLQKYSIYMEAGKQDEAFNELTKAREVFPNEASLIGTTVDYYYQTGQPGKAANMLEELVKADPGNGRAHLALADVYRKEGDEIKAFESLKMAFKSDDVDVDTKMGILIKVHETSYKIDPEIYELVDIVVEKYPKEAKAHSINGDYLLSAKKDDEALAAYKKALEFDANTYPIWNQVLIMEYQQGKNEELYQDSKRCLELFPTIGTVYLLNGVSANQTKRYSEALEILTVGQEMIYNDKPIRAEFLGQLGEASFGLKEYTQGKEYYKKALEVDPNSQLLKNNYAYRLANANMDLDLAESLCKQVVLRAPNESQFLDTYGWVLFQKKEYSKAKAEFESAYAYNTTDETVMEHLGDVYFKLKDLEKALVWWERAKAIKSNDLLDKKIADKKYYAPQL